jgi:TPR repeat protein
MENILLNNLISKAKAGDTFSQYQAACHFQENKDYDSAFKYCYLATFFAYAPAERKLGYFYEMGLGIKQDYQKAYEYYSKAVEHSDIAALTNLGMLYIFGKGVDQDIEKGLALIENGASQNNIKAIRTLAALYHQGTVIEKDEGKYISLLKQALYLGDKSAYYALGIASKNNNQNELAFQYFNLGARENDKDSYLALAICLFKGEGTSKDQGKAFYWFQKASNENIPKAMYYLAHYYEKGIYISQNIERALYWLKIAKELGLKEAEEKIKQLQNQ